MKAGEFTDVDMSTARVKTSRERALEDAAHAVCRYCLDGVPLINGEWHSIQFYNPDERINVYCLATPIRALS